MPLTSGERALLDYSIESFRTQAEQRNNGLFTLKEFNRMSNRLSDVNRP